MGIQCHTVFTAQGSPIHRVDEVKRTQQETGQKSTIKVVRHRTSISFQSKGWHRKLCNGHQGNRTISINLGPPSFYASFLFVFAFSITFLPILPFPFAITLGIALFMSTFFGKCYICIWWRCFWSISICRICARNFRNISAFFGFDVCQNLSGIFFHLLLTALSWDLAFAGTLAPTFTTF